jgi:hypothetical protein
MRLNKSETSLFFKIQFTLLIEVNTRLKVIPDDPKTGKPILNLDVDLLTIRNRLWENPEIINEIISDCRSKSLSSSECDIMAGWLKYHVKDTFVVFEHLPKYSLVMNMSVPNYVYGIHGLKDSFADTFYFPLPCMTNLVLLPFKDKIIYDGMSIIEPNSVVGSNNYKPLDPKIDIAYENIKSNYHVIEKLNGQKPTPKQAKT